MEQFKDQLKKSLQIWLLLFVGLTAVNWQDGGLNAASRFAAIQAMSEDHSFQINPYQSWTEDWSQTPTGAIYSNKAPGPMLMAAPVAWVLNRAKILMYGPLTEPGLGYMTLISWIFQVLPYLFLVFLSAKWLRKRGTSYAAINFTVIALLFGNTLSIFLNMYFGHAVAGWALLGTFLCLFSGEENKKKYIASGFLFGLSMLSDYGTAFVAIPFFVAALMSSQNQSKPKALGQIALGGLLPAILFAWYHTTCFGKPWALPMQFQNPHFVESTTDSPRIWGVAAPIPDWGVFLRLCFGNQRGILFTQPWVWVTTVGIGWLAWRQKVSRDLKASSIFALGGLFGLLWMNAGFNGWHGGSSAGPRYLSIIFPCVALVTGLLYDRLPSVFQKLLWITLAYSVFFRIVVYCALPVPYWPAPLWTYYWDYFVNGPRLMLRLVTFVLAMGCFTWATLSVWKRRKEPLTV